MATRGNNLGVQLTLFQPRGGADYDHLITTRTPGFESVTAALCLDHQTCHRQLTSVVNPGVN